MRNDLLRGYGGCSLFDNMSWRRSWTRSRGASSWIVWVEVEKKALILVNGRRSDQIGGRQIVRMGLDTGEWTVLFQAE